VGLLEKPGLGSLLSELCGMASDKRIATSDWRKRPLSEEMLYYCVLDVYYLQYIAKTLVDLAMSHSSLLDSEASATKAEGTQGASTSPRLYSPELTQHTQHNNEIAPAALERQQVHCADSCTRAVECSSGGPALSAPPQHSRCEPVHFADLANEHPEEHPEDATADHMERSASLALIPGPLDDLQALCAGSVHTHAPSNASELGSMRSPSEEPGQQLNYLCGLDVSQNPASTTRTVEEPLQLTDGAACSSAPDSVIDTSNSMFYPADGPVQSTAFGGLRMAPTQLDPLALELGQIQREAHGQSELHMQGAIRPGSCKSVIHPQPSLDSGSLAQSRSQPSPTGEQHEEGSLTQLQMLPSAQGRLEGLLADSNRPTSDVPAQCNDLPPQEAASCDTQSQQGLQHASLGDQSADETASARKKPRGKRGGKRARKAADKARQGQDESSTDVACAAPDEPARQHGMDLALVWARCAKLALIVHREGAPASHLCQRTTALLACPLATFIWHASQHRCAWRHRCACMQRL
jgi:hypothetical protein